MNYESQPALFGMTFNSNIVYEAHLQFIDSNPSLCNQEVISSSALTEPANDGIPIAMLVERGGCTFEDKARAAQALGYVKYVVVFDNLESSPLIPMQATEDQGIHVGMIFISNQAGLELKAQLDNQSADLVSKGGFIVLLDSIAPWSATDLFDDSTEGLILSLMFSFFFFIMCSGCFFFCIRTGMIRREGNVIIVGSNVQNFQGLSLLGEMPRLLTDEEVASLPTIEYGSLGRGEASTQKSMLEKVGGDDEMLSESEESYSSTLRYDSTTCSICLEEYSTGEILTLLPCNHIFHTCCIGQWLTERHTLCPLCKAEVLPDLNPSEEVDRAGENNNVSSAPDENNGVSSSNAQTEGVGASNATASDSGSSRWFESQRSTAVTNGRDGGDENALQVPLLQNSPPTTDNTTHEARGID